MADSNVVVEIEAEDSGVKKGLEDVGDAAKDTAKDVDELGKKAKKTESEYDKLTKAIDDQQAELSDLADEYKQAVVNFGKSSTEATTLKKRMSDLNDELKDNKSKLESAEKASKKFSSALDDAADDSQTLDIAVGNLVAEGITTLISSFGDAVGSVMALAEETREYREDMAKMDAAFKTAGHTTDTARKAYEGFYAILGESDRSVEAINHLAELTSNTEELADWQTIAAGVTAKFGDSLPIEGLTEAANETAKVGQVTGPLADALNWAGISEDAFNEKLAECNSEQERATLITETLTDKYQAAADEYNELTGQTQNARLATAEMEAAQANLGAAIEPVTTAWTRLKANALEAILPVVQTVVDWLNRVTTWMEENPEKAEVVKGVIIGITAALGSLLLAFGSMAIIDTVKSAFAALNLTMSANPITLVVAAIAGLVAAFLYLWENCDGFREFWISLWEKIKEIAGAVAVWFKETWAAVLAWFKEAVATIKTFFANAWAGVKAAFSNTIIGAYFKAIWETIKGIFSVVKSVLSGNWTDAWNAIKSVVNTWRAYFATVWNNIKAVFSSVKSTMSGYWSSAWTAIKNTVSTWRSYFSNVWSNIKGVFSGVGGWFSDKFKSAKNSIVNVFSDIKSKFYSIGDNLVTGIWNGINGNLSWIKGKIEGWVGNVKSFLKRLFDINSPSGWARDEIGEMLPPGMAIGFDNAMPEVEKQMEGDIDALTAKMQATVDAETVKVSNGYTAQYDGTQDIVRAVGTQTAGINSLASEYRRGSSTKQPIVLMVDKRELGRAVVDVSSAETERVGLSYA